MAGRVESPAVARRRVRLALRRAREAAGLSQGAVAERVGWSVSKVQRIEAGDNAISTTDLRALLDLYEVTDAEEIDQLTEEARISRRQRWWAKPDFRDHLTPGTLQLLQFEAEAAAIRAYQPVLVPGPLQTPEYAEYLLNWYQADLSPEDRRVRHEVRMERRAELIEADEGPIYYLILDESFLKREIGGPRVMADQLEQLAQFARKPRVYIRIIPLKEGGMLGFFGPFVVIDLDDDVDNAVVYREGFNRDSIEHDPKEVAIHREMFERYWGQALDKEQTIRAIVAEAAQLRTALDRT
jgi:transcriptional regulator with XRE-family HTH domain